jgi:hypothetical protein
MKHYELTLSNGDRQETIIIVPNHVAKKLYIKVERGSELEDFFNESCIELHEVQGELFYQMNHYHEEVIRAFLQENLEYLQWDLAVTSIREVE